MDIAHGLLMFIIGMPITIIGFFIAYKVAFNAAMNSNKKSKPSPLDGILGTKWKGDDCQ